MYKYLNAIREKVCSICIDSDEKGNYEMTKEECWAVELYLDRIVQIVHSIQSERMSDYFEALHQKICVECSGDA